MRTFGRYELVEPIASGGMAEVWRARAVGPAGVEKEVALKLVRRELDARPEFARMFVEEARLAARLTHANVVQVFELVEEEGRHAIAMELVRGHDLARVLERARQAGLRLGLPRALQVVAGVARALDYAHRRAEGGRPLGIVHRDVSPHNVLLSFEGEVKLADFGIARAASQAGLTDPGTVKGKLAYMAPEQAGGEAVDGRADVFALGVLAWELCTGRRLFARDTEAATLAAVVSGPPISPPSAWNEAVPPALDAAILGALARDPAARTASAGEVAEAASAVLLKVARGPEDLDLRAFMHQLWPGGAVPAAPPEATVVRSAAPGEVRTRARPPAAPPAAGRAPAQGGEPAATETLLAARRRPASRAVLGAAVALALAVAVAAASRGRPPAAVAPVGEAPPRGDAMAGAPLTVEPGLDGALAARGEGRVLVTVHPWALLSVDGQAVGETPQDLRLPAGLHRLSVRHPALGGAELELDVEPGRQVTWRPALGR